MQFSLNSKSGNYQKVEKFDTDTTEKLVDHYHEIIKLLGEDPAREGLQNTPLRLAKSMQFLLQGY